MPGQSGGFATIYTDSAQGTFLLDLTESLGDGGSLLTMVSAMSVGGSFSDGIGQIARLGMPLEETEVWSAPGGRMQLGPEVPRSRSEARAKSFGASPPGAPGLGT